MCFSSRSGRRAAAYCNRLHNVMAKRRVVKRRADDGFPRRHWRFSPRRDGDSVPQTIAAGRGGGRMGVHSYGTMAVDWEERVRFDRLRDERLARIKGLLAESSIGALLCFD